MDVQIPSKPGYQAVLFAVIFKWGSQVPKFEDVSSAADFPSPYGIDAIKRMTRLVVDPAAIPVCGVHTGSLLIQFLLL